MLALSAPDALWVTGEDSETAEVVEEAYQAADARESLTMSKSEDAKMAAARWLLAQDR